MLVPFLPNTQMSGGQTRWYNLIKYLSNQHEITLMSLIKDDWEKKFIPDLEKYCKKVMVFRRPKSPWTLKNLFLSLVGPYPLVVIRNLALDERRAIKKELADKNYDIIHAETFYVMPHIPKVVTPIVLVEPTIEFSVYKHYVDSEVAFFAKPIYMYDILKLKYWEKHYWEKADKLFAVSDEDRKVIQKEVPSLNVDVLPNGVDYQYFREKRRKKKSPPRVLYVGNFKWMQNVEAVDILIGKVWPKIKKRIKNVKLWIVGVNMPEHIHGLSEQDKDIEITEAIPDIRDAYRASSVLVAPIKGPGGTRLKVLEAMASGLPVVSTSVGVAGLGITAGKQALVSQSPNGLAELTVRVLEDRKFSAKIGKAGEKFVAKNFDWRNIVDKLNVVYKSIS